MSTLTQKKVIFDLDGTLADSSEPVLFQLHKLVEEFGTAPKTDEEIIHAVHSSGGAIKDILRILLGEHGIDEALIHARHSELIVESRHLIKPYLGVIETIEALQAAGYDLAIFTSRDKRMLQDPCCELLLPYFEVLISLEHVSKPKPHPEGVLAAAAALGVDAGDTIMVGDTAPDIVSGKTAGAVTIGITHGYGSKQSLEAAGADHIISSFEELRNLLLGARQKANMIE